MNKKALSSIIGSIFMIFIIGMIASSYFLFTLAQNTAYNDSVRSNNVAELVRMSESIKATTQASYTQSGTGVQVSVNLQNDGPIAAKIITLWVKSDPNANDNYGFLNLNIDLPAGESYQLNRFVPAACGVLESGSCYGWIITARGRTFELYPDHGIGLQGPQGETGPTGPIGPAGPTGPQGITSYDANTALVSQGIGSISMNFKTFRTYVAGASNQLTNESPAYTFSRSQKVAFKLNVTNMDPTGDITLIDQSCIWIFSPASGAIKGVVWKIASVSNNIITPLSPGQSVVLAYNVPTTLYFGPVVANVNSIDGGITGVNLILIGTVGTSDYGQNLPFISLMAT